MPSDEEVKEEGKDLENLSLDELKVLLTYFENLFTDFEKEVVEKEYEIIVENKKDLERGVNLHYSNCYITDMKRGSNHYHIDENGVLWGEGTSEYGQLGILKKDVSIVGKPVKIAENVIHVDFSGEYFVIYLTADYELYGWIFVPDRV